jgi:hypothetical protein
LSKVKQFLILGLLLIIPLHPALAQPIECRNAWAGKFDTADQLWLNSIDRILQQTTPSSILLPYVISDFRSYTCHLRAACIDVQYSNLPPEEEIYLNLPGCFPQGRRIIPIPACHSDLPDTNSDLVEQCHRQVRDKIEIGKVFLKSIMHRDAYHKKTGFLVYRYELLLHKIDTLMHPHLRLMLGYFTEFVNRAKCYLEECDRS